MLQPDEIVVDNFAGGGGASLGISLAIGREPDIALNHDAEACAMYQANHPGTKVYCQSVWKADPRDVVANDDGKPRPVGLAWFSPDCKHFSKAKGGKPVEKHIRDLAWVVVHWAKLVKPRIIALENVEEFRDWGPLVQVADGKLMPCPARKGFTFRRWVKELRKLGYQVEWRDLRACDYGAPTIRKRLFLVARCDGQPIVWPEPSHGPKGTGLPPYRTAAECIDWSIPCPSIFGRKKPLAENTLRRIARGIKRYVIDAAEPFIVPASFVVPVTHHGDDRCHAASEPLRTITTAKRGEMALVTPFVSRVDQTSAAGRNGIQSPEVPLRTVTTAGSLALVSAFLAQHNAGPRNDSLAGRAADQPISTITQSGAQQQVVTSHLVKLRGTCQDGQPVTEPMPTVTSGGLHVGEVRAFLVKYFGTAIGQDLREPMHTTTARARFGLVVIAGEEYEIVDIGMRMLTPRELFRAQGFPDSYVIDCGPDGRPITKTAQIGRCGNSVCPPVATALVCANLDLPLPARVAA